MPGDWAIVVIALMGLLGGSLAAAVSIRNLRGTSAPYDVPIALAMLKVPLGAFTAIIGLVAIRGEFVPGLTALDSQEQILAYALVLGFAQQVFTRLLDRRAEDLLQALPSKDATTAPAPATAPTAPPTLLTATDLAELAGGPGRSTASGRSGEEPPPVASVGEPPAVVEPGPDSQLGEPPDVVEPGPDSQLGEPPARIGSAPDQAGRDH
ncbi:MAG: hypothetical protein L0Y54_02635 [Sporichthyaceae bacterium]|nr:hypothetical protein [Sporichthyaceae bacterium]